MAKNDPTPQYHTSQSTTTQELSPEQRQVLNLALPGVMSFGASVPQRYQGSTIAGFDPSQTAGQEMALGAAGRQNSLAGNAANASDFWMSDAIWRPENNPALQGAVDAATRPITQQLTESILPGIRSGAVASGNFGSSRQGIAEGLASGRASQAVGDAASRVVNDNYRTNVDAQLRTLGMLPQTQAAQTAGAQTTSAVGDVRQALEQARLGEAAGNFTFDQYAPYLQSRELLSFLQGIPGGSTTSSGRSEASTPQPNRTMGALGGAASGAALGSMFGPWGTGIGALLGGGLSFL